MGGPAFFRQSRWLRNLGVIRITAPTPKVITKMIGSPLTTAAILLLSAGAAILSPTPTWAYQDATSGIQVTIDRDANRALIETQAQACSYSGRFSKEAEYRTSLVKAISEDLGPDHPEARHQRSRLSSALRTSQLNAADLTTIISLRKKVGDAIDLFFQKRDPNCLPELREAIDGQACILGDEDGATIDYRYFYGCRLAEAGQHAEAISVFASIVEPTRRSQGDSNTSRLYNAMCLSCQEVGRFDEAVRCGLAATGRAKEGWGEGALEHAATLYNLGTAYVRADRAADAIPLLKQSGDALESLGGNYRSHALMSRCELARAFADAGRSDEALELYKSTIADIEQLASDQDAAIRKLLPVIQRRYELLKVSLPK